jgi:ABC-2 type transport system permease protein
MLQRIWTLIRKELQAQLRDRDSRRLLIVPVILQLAVFPFALTLEVKNNTLAIYNQDSGDNSVELMQRFSKASAFPTLKILHNITEVQDTIDNQRALLVITFPSDFSRKVLAGRPATLQVIIDGRRSNAAQIAASYIQDIVTNYNNDIKSDSFVAPTTVIRDWFNPNLDYKWFILPCLVAIITTIGCLTVTAMSVAREREQGTFEQLLVSPLTTGYIMFGKTIPALLIAAVQATIILFASIWIYGVPFQGSILLLYICLLCYGLALSGIGLLISAISSTQQQAFLGVFGFLMPAIMLSGYISPIENIPEPLRAITWFNPVRHFILLAKGIYLKGISFELAWQDLWHI